jgi:hypothetical protein
MITRKGKEKKESVLCEQGSVGSEQFVRSRATANQKIS